MAVADCVIKVPCKGNFFRWWLEFLKPLHHLTDREMDVTAIMIKQYFELSNNIVNNDMLLNSVFFSEENKRKVREEAGITAAYFQCIMSKLKKVKVIKDGKLNPKFIPMINKGSNNFKLMVLFDYDK